MFETNISLNRVSVVRKIARLRYQDGSSMVEHLNAFQGLINQIVSLEIPLAYEVLALLVLGSLPDSSETHVVTLGNSTPQGKQLTLDTLKSSLLNEVLDKRTKSPTLTIRPYSQKVTLIEKGESREMLKLGISPNLGRSLKEG